LESKKLRKEQNIETRSEQIQEILNAPPPNLILWGNSILILIFILLLSSLFIIRYPEVIKAETVLTTQIPPQKLIVNFASKLDSIYVQDSEYVTKDQIIASLENSANTQDVYYLKSIVDTFDFKTQDFQYLKLPNLQLGEIQLAYQEFERNYIRYELNKKLRPFDLDQASNEYSVLERKEQLKITEQALRLKQKEINLLYKEIERYKKLYEKGVIAQQELELKELKLLNEERNIRSLSTSISELKNLNSEALNNSLRGEIERRSTNINLERNYVVAHNNLKSAIEEWENTYILKSIINGTVYFSSNWTANQNIPSGETIFTIVPNSEQGFTALAKAPGLNSGKIQKGQNVQIDLIDFPEHEYGYLEGYVSSIAPIPNNDGTYNIDIVLKDSLYTNYGNLIDFRQEMRGTSSIITEELTLFDRIFYQLRKVFNNLG